MKRLSKKQKLQAYTYALFHIYDFIYSKGLGDPYVCNNLSDWLDKRNIKFDVSYFPEFAINQPEENHHEGGWWPEKQNSKRIAAIERAIALTEKLKS